MHNVHVARKPKNLTNWRKGIVLHINLSLFLLLVVRSSKTSFWLQLLVLLSL